MPGLNTAWISFFVCFASSFYSKLKLIWRNLRYPIYSMVKETTFLKRVFVFIRFHGRFVHFDIGVKDKPQNVHRFEIDFLLNFAPDFAMSVWMGLTYQRQTAKIKLTSEKTREKLPATDRKQINRQPAWSNIVRIFVFRNKSFFLKLVFYLPSFVKSIPLDLFPAQGTSLS